jgi:hypothetical protein
MSPFKLSYTQIIGATLAWIFCAITSVASYAQPDIQQELDAAQNTLESGRIYQLGFPEGKTRKVMREDYLGLTDSAPKFDILANAIKQGLAIRTDPARALVATRDQRINAQTIAWEALESLLQGQIVAGNGNLLRGLRVAFPSANGPEKPIGDSQVPIGCPVDTNGEEYRGANILDLCYAQSHFFRGISATTQYLASEVRDGDVPGRNLIRATDFLNTPNFPQYTVFEDPNFATVDNPDGIVDMQTTGYLLGNALDRYGKSIIGMADRLWKAAYFDATRTANERQRMLDDAVKQLQEGIHAQYLATLPVAATLSDGVADSSTGFNEYQLGRFNQVRVSTATATSFINRIQRGEIPKFDDLSLNATTSAINDQIALVNGLKAQAASRFAQAEQAIWRTLESQAAAISDAMALRSQYEDALIAAVGFGPGGELQAPYFGLRTEAGQQAYRAEIANRIDVAFNASVTDPILVNLGDLGQSILQMRRAFAELDSARNRIDSIPQQIRIEEERVGAVNGVILGTAEQIGAYQLAIGIANSVTVTMTAGVSCGPPPNCPSVNAGIAVTTNPGAIVSAIFQNKITRAQAIQQVEINDINAAATIRNLLLQQHQYVLDMDAAVAQAQLAIAQVNATIARIDRLIENHLYYQSASSEKWYNDPALIFEQEEAELEYEETMEEYRRQLYILAQLLAARWGEPFENPYLNQFAVPVTLGGGLYDDFTQIESIFAVLANEDADQYFSALNAWNNVLRTQRLGGEGSFTNRLSLRQDIFGLSDYAWNGSQFTLKPPQEIELNIRRFHARLLNAVQPASSGLWLRLEFPLTYNQVSQSRSGSEDQLIIEETRENWNVRVTELSARLVGENIAPGSPTGQFLITLYQYGKIEFEAYHPRQASVYPNFLTYDLPLYYNDPQEASTTPYRFQLSAGVNGNTGVPENVFVADAEPSPYCSRYVLLIPRSSGNLNVQNIEDIELTISWRAGRPPQFNF